MHLHARPPARVRRQLVLNRDLHIYCEKPLAISVEEARVVRENWLKRKNKVATQVGMQRHAFENFERVRELVCDGAIGELKSASAWGNRQIRRSGYWPAEGQPPKTLHYDLWLGPSPFHPYNPAYFVHRPGVGSCLSWNMFWDFAQARLATWGATRWTCSGMPLMLAFQPQPKGRETNSIPTLHPSNAKRIFSTRPTIGAVRSR